jgi:predicted acylesterase/phospholipase RssA
MAPSIATGALILKGGGVKGLAFAGAVQELERFGYSFTTYVGTSAGSIAAVLLAAGFDGRQLEIELRKKDFRELLDGSSRPVQWVGLLRKGGMHSGVPVRAWIDELLAGCLHNGSDAVRMCDLKSRAIVYAAAKNKGTVVFDSQGDNKDMDTSFAVRCSSSIPFFFVPERHNGEKVYDGGLLHNFPVEIYLQSQPGSSFLGIYLVPEDARERKPKWLPFEVFDIMRGQDEKRVVSAHSSNIIQIDPSPIRTTQFALTNAEKDFLIAQGRAAALRFIAKRGGPGPSAEELVRAIETAFEAKRKLLKPASVSPWRRRTFWLAIIITIGLSAALWFRRPVVARGLELIDPVLFNGEPEEGYVVARLLATRENLLKETNFGTTLKEATTSFDMLAINAATILQNFEQALSDAVQRGVHVRLLLLDPTSTDFELLCRSIDREPEEIRTESQQVKRFLGELRTKFTEQRDIYRGDLEVRWWKGPILYTAWLRDMNQKSALLQIGVYSYRGEARWPYVRVGRDGMEAMKSFAQQFAHLWEHSAP